MALFPLSCVLSGFTSSTYKSTPRRNNMNCIEVLTKNPTLRPRLALASLPGRLDMPGDGKSIPLGMGPLVEECHSIGLMRLA